MANILIIDDDQLTRKTIASIVQSQGHEVHSASTLVEGIKKAQTGYYDVVFLDVKLPDGNGLTKITNLQAVDSQPEVIILTGYSNPDGAETAIKAGAWDYIKKPTSFNELNLILNRVLQYRKEKQIASTAFTLKRGKIVGNSPAIKRCLMQISQASLSDVDVLITGDTGSGKELFARTIHENSHRAEKNFVVVDCSAIPETLVESTLFGHEKGAFTGADIPKEGLIQQANKGTLFLDEIGELPFSIQKSFLRVLQERTFRPIGSKKEIVSDFRLIAATNRNIEEMAKKNEFRQDLLFRIRSLNIHLPPLRERPEDIKDLVLHYLTRIDTYYGTGTKGISQDFWDSLYKYDWPGNVRELFQALEHAHTTAFNDPILYAKHLPTHIRIKLINSLFNDTTSPVTCNFDDPDISLIPLQELKDFFLADLEKKYLTSLMARTNWDIKEACRISDLSRSRLYSLLKKYNIASSR